MQNIALNKISEAPEDIGPANPLLASQAAAINMDANALMHSQHFGYIDIDPFGTPMPFIDAAIQSIKNKGVLGITATDTAPLCGAHKAACIRRYKARPIRGSQCHEIGLRILLGYIAREAIKHDAGIRPLLCYYMDHYFRVYVQIIRGARRADKALEEIGFYTTSRESAGEIRAKGRILPGSPYLVNFGDILSDTENPGKKRKRGQDDCRALVDRAPRRQGVFRIAGHISQVG